MSQKQTVLAMLREGPQTTADFLDAGIPRYSARIAELRQEGYSIPPGERVRKGSWVFKLEYSERVLILDYRQAA